MPTLNVNDASMYYEIHGQGTPLVLISGYGCDHNVWLPLLDKLASLFKVIIFDNRGSGQTLDDDSDFNIETLAEDCFQLTQLLNIQKPHVLGHSMGGEIAQWMAIQYPEHINKLLIFNSQSKVNEIALKALEALLKLQQANLDLNLIMDNFMPWGFSEEFLSDPEKVLAQKKFMKEYPHRQTARGNERQLNALKKFDTRTVLKKIKTPTLIFGCNRDLLISNEEILFLHQHIQHSILKQLPGSHLMIFEKPDLAFNIIQEFLIGTNK